MLGRRQEAAIAADSDLPMKSGFHSTAKQNQEKYLWSGRCNSNKKSLVLDAY